MRGSRRVSSYSAVSTHGPPMVHPWSTTRNGYRGQCQAPMRASRGEARLDSQTGHLRVGPSASSPLGPVRRVGGSIGDWCTHQFASGRFLELGTPLSEVRVRDREGLPWADEKALLDTLALSRLVNRQINDSSTAPTEAPSERKALRSSRPQRPKSRTTFVPTARAHKPA